jgi:hypothetical protein
MRTIHTILALTLTVNVFAQIPTNGLVGYWPFNGNANDLSGNENNGNIHEAILTDDRFGKPNNAYYFNGATSYIKVLNATSLNVQFGNSLSISCWIKHDLTSQNINTYFISKYGGSTFIGAAYAMGTQLESNGYCWFQIAAVNTNGRDLQGNNTINDGLWHHLAVVLEMNSSLKLFIDGVLGPYSAFPLNGSIINEYDLHFGSGANLDQFYKGCVDDIRMYNRSLSQPEVINLFNEGLCYQHISVTDTLIINTSVSGFNPVTYRNAIKIYPNPLNDHISIDFGSN